MAAYAGQTALTALWNKLVAVLAGKADRNSVYSKAEVDYKLATTYGTGSGSGGGDTSDCVHITGTETVTGTKTFVSSGFKIRSTSTSYSATIANAASANKTINLPTGTGTTHYLVSRTSTSLTSGQLTAWDGTTGILKNSGYAVDTSITSSSAGIPTSAAVRSYVESNSGGSSGGGGGGVYEYIIDGYIYGGEPWAILLNYDSITAPSSSTYK